jgi:hypothetical protein
VASNRTLGSRPGSARSRVVTRAQPRQPPARRRGTINFTSVQAANDASAPSARRLSRSGRGLWPAKRRMRSPPATGGLGGTGQGPTDRRLDHPKGPEESCRLASSDAMGRDGMASLTRAPAASSVGHMNPCLAQGCDESVSEDRHKPFPHRPSSPLNYGGPTRAASRGWPYQLGRRGGDVPIVDANPADTIAIGAWQVCGWPTVRLHADGGGGDAVQAHQPDAPTRPGPVRPSLHQTMHGWMRTCLPPFGRLRGAGRCPFRPLRHRG